MAECRGLAPHSRKSTLVSTEARLARPVDIPDWVGPLPGKLRNQILPSCSPLRVSNSQAARFTQPRLPSRSPKNRRSPDGEKASAEIPPRGQTVCEGLEGRNKPPVSDSRFQTESSFTSADAAQRSST